MAELRVLTCYFDAAGNGCEPDQATTWQRLTLDGDIVVKSEWGSIVRGGTRRQRTRTRSRRRR